MTNRSTMLLCGILLLARERVHAERGQGLKTGQTHHVVVTSNPTQGLEEGIPRASHYARGIQNDIRGQYDESFRAYLKARRDFEKLAKERPAWARVIRGWILKADFQTEQSRALRHRRYFRPHTGYARYHRTAAKHNKWLAIRAYTGRHLRTLARQIVADYREILRRSPHDQRTKLALAAFYHELGRHADARRTFATAGSVSGGYLAQDAAYYHATAGNLRLAFKHLETAVRYRHSARRQILRSNRYDRLRSEPRFRALVGEP